MKPVLKLLTKPWCRADKDIYYIRCKLLTTEEPEGYQPWSRANHDICVLQFFASEFNLEKSFTTVGAFALKETQENCGDDYLILSEINTTTKVSKWISEFNTELYQPIILTL